MNINIFGISQYTLFFKIFHIILSFKVFKLIHLSQDINTFDCHLSQVWDLEKQYNTGIVGR